MAKHNGTVVTSIDDLDGIDFDAFDTVEGTPAANPQRPKRAKRLVVTILVASLLAPFGPILTIPWCIYRKRQWRKICSSQ